MAMIFCKSAAGTDVQRSPSFIKWHGAQVENDWRRVLAFSQQVSRVEGLITPAPLWMDHDHRTIGYRWMPQLLPSVRDFATLPQRMHRCGVELARFHSIPVDAAWRAGFKDEAYPLESLGITVADARLLESSLPCGFFWGDAWHGNLHETKDGAIVVLDPILQKWLFTKDDYLIANGAIDLATLHMSLFFSQSLWRLITIDAKTLFPAARELLRGYLGEVGALHVEPALLRLSRALALRHVDAYSVRLIAPIALAKQSLSRHLMHNLDEALNWRML